MALSLLRSFASRATTLAARFAAFALPVVLAVAFAPERGHAQRGDYVPGASAHPHGRADAPIPTPRRPGFRACRMWVYEGPDSTGKRLKYQQRFNAQGWLVEDIQYARRQGHPLVLTAERSYYHGGRLTQQIHWRRPGQGKADAKLRTRLSYNRQGQLVRQERVEFVHQVKRGLVRGRGSGGPDLVTLGDLERRRRPSQRTEAHYTYTPQGQVAEEVVQHGTDYSREAWAYDSMGRRARHTAYERGAFRWVEHYRYWRVAEDSWCDRTWSDTDVPASPVEARPPDETPPHTVRTYFDAQQREVRQVRVDAPGAVPEVVLTRYDAEGRVQQVQTLDPTGEPLTTLVYSYP